MRRCQRKCRSGLGLRRDWLGFRWGLKMWKILWRIWTRRYCTFSGGRTRHAVPLRVDGVVEPGEVGFRTGDDGQGDELGDVVAVETPYFPLQGAELSCRSLDEQQKLAGFFDLAFPTIVGLDGAA